MSKPLRFSVDFVKTIMVSQLEKYKCKIHVGVFDENCKHCHATMVLRETSRLMAQQKIYEAIFGKEPRRGHTAYTYSSEGRRIGFDDSDGRIHGPTKRRWERGGGEGSAMSPYIHGVKEETEHSQH